MWIARARAVEVRGGFARARAIDIADATTATGVLVKKSAPVVSKKRDSNTHHGVLMSSDIFLNDLLLNGVDYGRLCRVARGGAEVASTTAAGGEDLKSRRRIGDHEDLQ